MNARGFYFRSEFATSTALLWNDGGWRIDFTFSLGCWRGSVDGREINRYQNADKAVLKGERERERERESFWVTTGDELVISVRGRSDLRRAVHRQSV